MPGFIPHSELGTCSPLTALVRHFSSRQVTRRFDAALSMWSRNDPDLETVTDVAALLAALAVGDFERHDAVLHALLRRAAETGETGLVASELVVFALVPAVPGMVMRVLAAAKAKLRDYGPSHGVTGGGMSKVEDSWDVQAAVLGHLWEQVRCYPLHRRQRVAANVVLDAQRRAFCSFGLDATQPAADIVSIDVDDEVKTVAPRPVEMTASEELLHLMTWAVEHERLDSRSAKILAMRYFGDRIGRDGVATDRQIAEALGVSQPTATRYRHHAEEQLTRAAVDYPGPTSGESETGLWARH